MCNLYRMTNSIAEVARLFDASGDTNSNAGGMVYPGGTGLVVSGGEVRSMVWGFPLALKSKRTGEPLKPKPVNNARSDKLDSFFWRSSFENRRCLIPVNAFAEAEGAKGAKTRTWFTVPDDDDGNDSPLFACAGVWCDSDEFGPSYSMVMTDANDVVCRVHDRMPIVLQRDDWERWVESPPEEAKLLCQPYPAAMAVDRTAETWNRC